MSGFRHLRSTQRKGGYLSGVPETDSGVWTLRQRYERIASPLFEYFPGAAAGYSLRQLAYDYTGPVVTVRRSSDSVEDDFTASEVADGTLAAFCGAGDGLVKTLYDQSGNGRDASQSTATAQPKIVSGGVLVLENGLPAMDFDGSNDYLANTTHNWAVQPTDDLFAACLASPQSTGMTIAASRDYAGTLSYKGWQWRLDASTNYMRILNYNGSVADASLSNFAPTLNDQSLLVARLASNGDHGVFANGSDVETSDDDSLTAYTPATDDLLVGAVGIIGGTIADYFDGTLQELIIYPVDQSANRLAIEDNINSHYNVF